MAAKRDTSPASAAGRELHGQALVDHLAQQIQARIMSGELARGTRLRQEALADDFGVSRTPVREALRQLQASGMLVVEPRRGAIVHGPSARDIRESYFVRAELEAIAAELATERINDDQLALLRETVDRFQTIAADITGADRTATPADADVVWAAANETFHDVILEAADNRRLRSTVEHLYLSGAIPHDIAWAALASSSRLLHEDAEQHAQILAAIEANRAAQARKLMRQHVARSGELVARLHERNEDAAAA
jgi:DNA-binding GntR family transcriptional regulator